MKFHQLLLLPASWLYRAITSLRNQLYESKVLSSQQFRVPVLVVGNLSVGGTGKTPHTEYIIRLLKDNFRVTVLSRGYKRQTKGFIMADENATAATIGDEPMLYHTQFPDVQVAVGEDRPYAIEELLKLQPDTQVFLLDDAFQHRPLQASFYLMLTEFDNPFYLDLVLPAGRLREGRSGAERADAIVVTKSTKDITPLQRQAVQTHIARYAGHQTPVFFSTYTYGQPVWLAGRLPHITQKVLLLTAIANPKPLIAYLKANGHELVHTATFPDHYAYRKPDMEKLAKRAAFFPAGEVTIVTTSKDAIKLQSPRLLQVIKDIPVCYLPIEVEILAGEQAAFDQLILSAAGKDDQKVNEVQKG